MDLLSILKNRFSVKNLALLISAGAVLYFGYTCALLGRSHYQIYRASQNTVSPQNALQLINFDSSDPEVYKTRGLLHLKNENYPEAARAFEKAVSLSPNNYLLYLRLGYSFYKMNEFEKADVAYQKAIFLAPNYAAPQRYLGRLYLKTGDLNQAFIHLSRAGALDPELLPEVLQRARRSYRNDPQAIEKAVNPASLEAKKKLAAYLIKHELISDATRTFLLGDNLDGKAKSEFVNLLIAARNYSLAHAVWLSQEKNKSIESNSIDNLVHNPSFESEINEDEKGFGWKISRDKNIRFAVDRENPESGKIALEIKFNGIISNSEPVISQLLPVKAGKGYQLIFSARTHELVSGGLPVITVTDLAGKTVLGESSALTNTDNRWQSYTVNFKIPENAEVILLRIQRQKCSSNPCPIFGYLWLDNFVIRESSSN